MAQGGPGPGWTHINEDPGPGGTHISKDPGPRGTHISEDPGTRGTHTSEDPGPRRTHISEDPGPGETHISEDPRPRGTHISEDPGPRAQSPILIDKYLLCPSLLGVPNVVESKPMILLKASCQLLCAACLKSCTVVHFQFGHSILQ